MMHLTRAQGGVNVFISYDDVNAIINGDTEPKEVSTAELLKILLDGALRTQEHVGNIFTVELQTQPDSELSE